MLATYASLVTIFGGCSFYGSWGKAVHIDRPSQPLFQLLYHLLQPFCWNSLCLLHFLLSPIPGLLLLFFQSTLLLLVLVQAFFLSLLQMIFEKRNIQFERDKRQVPNDADGLRTGREREGQGMWGSCCRRWAVGVSVYVRSNYRAASFDGST